MQKHFQQFNYIEHQPLGYGHCFKLHYIQSPPVVCIKTHVDVGCSCILLPPKHVFFIFHKFPCSWEIPIRKKDTTESFIMLATDVLNEEFLSNGDSTIETYLLSTYMSVGQEDANIA